MQYLHNSSPDLNLHAKPRKFRGTKKLSDFDSSRARHGIVSEGLISGVLSGKHYNWSVLCHKIMYEALQCLRLKAFSDYQGQNNEMTSFTNNMAESFLKDLQCAKL